ncbi:DUF2799 domain-containing protein [Vibrio ostreicida]|uniref:DUF2799 domain-containing protein n=1 Tax=Vibrio ostreicida TaxID=526588 RepID=A0ABT8BSY2_9VIBR|nr:DUF2799 domain-containing protein [Vibrio ostreicida]MDN3610230.1 DUF2799 domain-containing protein [Vibrio ostreicida]NPD07752.1 DUF2799 domain-containing protein [Vibrio ostreicida]
MTKLFLMPASLLVLLSLSGCSSISEEECVLGDWYQIGLSDGQQGKRNSLALYSKDCAKYNVGVDSSSYSQGRLQGLTSYCTYENGILVGKARVAYHKVCPADLSKDFLAGYTPNFNLEQAKYRVVALKNNRHNYTTRLAEKNISVSERQQLELDLASSKSALESAESELARYQVEWALAKLQREMGQINTELAQPGASGLHKAQLNRRLATLNSQRTYYETLLQTGNTIKSINNIFDMF